MPCPRCRVDLVMSERQGIEIDYCPRCRGVWLDRGELDKIIERSAAFQGAPPPDTVPQAQPGTPGAPSPWVAPGQGAPGGYAPAAPPPGWAYGYDQHGGHGGHGGHGSGHGSGHGRDHGRRSGHDSFLGRLFR
ncbi:zf-TFIIB domain-containing protein [Roseicella sp. GB24]|uniref:Zf-TFIIB domain-containing protein n=2 Tax=Roseicella aerolata TaxID=2883479 RepID=A0A9X1LCY7_9PROT|nr:zf-TFIIB domain-containing protein [Roseicella aerolata]MCB4824558.1 zf-TFIIB domain-containing protein [Roseicella aerolata]